MTAIIDWLPRLAEIGRLEFSSRPGPDSRSGWQGHGSGRVQTSHDDMTVRFHESGLFRPGDQARTLAFSNVYRWEVEPERLRLFHERRGAGQAVWLFDLVALASSPALIDHCAHVCGDDRYSARLTPCADGFELTWRIRGPRKDEVLNYRYRRT